MEQTVQAFRPTHLDWMFAVASLALAATLLLAPCAVRAQAADPLPMLLSPPSVTDGARATVKARSAEPSVARHRPVRINCDSTRAKGGERTCRHVQQRDGARHLAIYDREHSLAPFVTSHTSMPGVVAGAAPLDPNESRMTITPSKGQLDANLSRRTASLRVEELEVDRDGPVPHDRAGRRLRLGRCAARLGRYWRREQHGHRIRASRQEWRHRQQQCCRDHERRRDKRSERLGGKASDVDYHDLLEVVRFEDGTRNRSAGP